MGFKLVKQDNRNSLHNAIKENYQNIRRLKIIDEGKKDAKAFG
jgi:hypothetical protein